MGFKLAPPSMVNHKWNIQYESMEYSIWMVSGMRIMIDKKWNINGNASGKMHGIKLVDGDSYPYDSVWYEWILNYWWWMEDEW